MPKPTASTICSCCRATAARALEPALNCDAALLSPSTGIIDSHAYMLALRGDAEEAGAAFAFHTPLLHARAGAGRIEIETGGDAPMTLACNLLVNSAGLGAPAVARSIEGMPVGLIPCAYLAKGNYFSCSARAPFSRLIYPVPEPGGLGVHLTLDMAGQARFGPDVEWVESIDYAVDPARAERFYPAIRRYWPTLPDGALMPSYSGIRPKIVPPAVATQDFLIQGPQRPRRCRADQSVRYRIAGTDIIACDRRSCRRVGGAVNGGRNNPHNQRMSASAPIRLRGVFDTLLD